MVNYNLKYNNIPRNGTYHFYYDPITNKLKYVFKYNRLPKYGNYVFMYDVRDGVVVEKDQEQLSSSIKDITSGLDCVSISPQSKEVKYEDTVNVSLVNAIEILDILSCGDSLNFENQDILVMNICGEVLKGIKGDLEFIDSNVDLDKVAVDVVNDIDFISTKKAMNGFSVSDYSTIVNKISDIFQEKDDKKQLSKVLDDLSIILQKERISKTRILLDIFTQKQAKKSQNTLKIPQNDLKIGKISQKIGVSSYLNAQKRSKSVELIKRQKNLKIEKKSLKMRLNQNVLNFSNKAIINDDTIDFYRLDSKKLMEDKSNKVGSINIHYKNLIKDGISDRLNIKYKNLFKDYAVSNLNIKHKGLTKESLQDNLNFNHKDLFKDRVSDRLNIKYKDLTKEQIQDKLSLNYKDLLKEKLQDNLSLKPKSLTKEQIQDNLNVIAKVTFESEYDKLKQKPNDVTYPNIKDFLNKTLYMSEDEREEFMSKFIEFQENDLEENLNKSDLEFVVEKAEEELKFHKKLWFLEHMGEFDYKILPNEDILYPPNLHIMEQVEQGVYIYRYTRKFKDLTARNYVVKAFRDDNLTLEKVFEVSLPNISTNSYQDDNIKIEILDKPNYNCLDYPYMVDFNVEIYNESVDYIVIEQPKGFNNSEVHFATTYKYYANNHPIPFGEDLGTREIPVPIKIMVDFVNIVLLIWGKRLYAFSGYTGTQAVVGMLDLLYEWLTLETSLEVENIEDYHRCYRWIRWEGEKVFNQAKLDHDLNGNYWIEKMVFELIDYLEKHHINFLHEWDKVFLMDEHRNIFQEPDKDYELVLDKIKGRRKHLLRKYKK